MLLKPENDVLQTNRFFSARILAACSFSLFVTLVALLQLAVSLLSSVDHLGVYVDNFANFLVRNQPITPDSLQPATDHVFELQQATHVVHAAIICGVFAALVVSLFAQVRLLCCFRRDVLSCVYWQSLDSQPALIEVERPVLNLDQHTHPNQAEHDEEMDQTDETKSKGVNELHQPLHQPRSPSSSVSSPQQLSSSSSSLPVSRLARAVLATRPHNVLWGKSITLTGAPLLMGYTICNALLLSLAVFLIYTATHVCIGADVLRNAIMRLLMPSMQHVLSRN
jgi:hypothetical protein